MPLERDLFETNLILNLFRTPDRAGLRDLLPALQLVDDRLAYFAEKKKNSPWESKSVDTQLVHTVKHLGAALAEMHDIQRLREQLAAVILRASMALTTLESRSLHDYGSVSDLRALTG